MFEALANWMVYDFAGLTGTPLGAALQFFEMHVAKILVLLTLVIYVMGLLRALLAPEKVRDFIRRPPLPPGNFLITGPRDIVQQILSATGTGK